MTRLLEGRVIAVTGAAQGLGRAYAEAAAAAGARLVLNDVEGEVLAVAAEQIRASGVEVETVIGPVDDWDVAARIVERAEQVYGGIDGLVNNAAIMPVGPPWEMTEQQIRSTVDVGVKGVVYCGTHALRSMVPRGRGAIVNVVSGAVFGIADLSLYGTVKGAVLAATYGWAFDARATGVRINAISPLARTRLTDAAGSGPGDQSAILPPSAIAPGVVYLLSDLSSALTGQILRFDGRTPALQGPPVFLASAPPREAWTAEEIAEFVSANGNSIPAVGLTGAVPAGLRAAAQRAES